MRKVKFPFELDATDLSSDALKAKILPLNSRLKEIEKDRAERSKVAKRTRKEKDEQAMAVDGAGASKDKDSPAETDEEKSKRKAEADELTTLVNEEFKNDTGCNPSGLYDLIGLVTHKGSSADGGHYIGWAKNVEKENSWFSELVRGCSGSTSNGEC